MAMAIGDKGILEKITIVLLIAALLVIGFNAFQIGQLKGKNNANTPITAQAVAENNPVNSEVVDLNIRQWQKTIQLIARLLI